MLDNNPGKIKQVGLYFNLLAMGLINTNQQYIEDVHRIVELIMQFNSQGGQYQVVKVIHVATSVLKGLQMRRAVSIFLIICYPLIKQLLEVQDKSILLDSNFLIIIIKLYKKIFIKISN